MQQRVTGDPPDPNRSAKDTSGTDGAAKITPMIAQYIEIKSVNPDCLLFYRMGDFYELFFDDAEIASRALGIVLTKRGKHLGRDIPMCGVPIERADDYLSRLIALGHRVAVCEQIEDPAEAKQRGGQSVVKRDVVRLVTPGTITEEKLLDPARANSLARHRKAAPFGDRMRPLASPASIFRPAHSTSPKSLKQPSARRSPVSTQPKSSRRRGFARMRVLRG